MKRLYRFLAIVIILIISQSGCVSALSATTVGADLITVTTVGHGIKDAGIIYITIDGDATPYPTYCMDIDISTQNGNRYELGGSGADPNIIWILNNYYPNTGLPDGLSNREKGAAVQLAIWHFSNGLDLSSGTPEDVFAAARAIVDYASSASIPQIPSTLDLAPSSSTNPLGAQHTVTATVLDPSGSAVSGQEVTFSVAGANPSANPVSVVTDANGQSTFTYTGTNAGDDTIAAATSFIVPSGAIWLGVTPSIQRLVMAQDVPRSLTQSATKRWSDSTLPTISSVVPSTNTPCGNENVDITAHVIDNIAVTSVTLVYTDQTGQHTVDMTGPDGSREGDWVGSIPGHDAGTTVTYKISARDQDGNEATSPSEGDYAVRWRDCAAPNILSVDVEPLNPCANEEVVLIAHITDDDGVVSVNLIYGSSTTPMVLQQGGNAQDGVWMSQSPIPGQTAGSRLEVQVEATDASDRSTTVSQFIHWRDCKGPMITEITPGSVDVCQGSSVEITARVTGTANINEVHLVYADPLGTHDVLMDPDASDMWTYTLSGCPTGTTTEYYILAIDTSGQSTRSDTYTLNWINCGITKSASSQTVSPGGLVTYTITYTNYWDDAVIDEDYPDKMIFISAYPQPDTGTNNRWTIPLGKGTITVTLRVPASSNTKFNFEQEASGVGFVRSWKDLSTAREPYDLVNKVTMSSPNSPPQIATSSITVTGGTGVELSQRESGSGEYLREDLITYNRKKNYIKEESNLSVKHQSTSFALPEGRTLNFNSTWNEAECVKNYLTSESLNELYRYSTKIDRTSLLEMEGNNTRMEVSSDFQGTRHMGYVKVAETDEKGHITLEKEASSDYSGSFKVIEKLGTTYTNGSTAITDVKHYDEPHLTVYQRGEQDATDSINLSYTISILNDGNAALGPIYVRDVFPAGTYFLDASIKPSEPRRSELFESRYANWTFTHLPIGQAVTIQLRVLRYVAVDVPINVVYVSAGYDGRWIYANDSTATNADYLSCSPQGICTKAQAGGGWNPPNWGFDLSWDTCDTCYRAGSNAQSNCAACNV